MNLLKAVLCFLHTPFPLNFHRVLFHTEPLQRPCSACMEGLKFRKLSLGALHP